MNGNILKNEGVKEKNLKRLEKSYILKCDNERKNKRKRKTENRITHQE